MPSAAKIEKTASIEAADPVKQFTNILEKRVRNLEKRKLKLDNYKSDVQNGKELNEDQKNAVSKYDQVLLLLDFSKDLCKLFNSTILETSRLQKKLAKKEQIERQQHEIQRLQEALYYKHILSDLENEEVRNDFLNGGNGATKLTNEDFVQLDQFYKLIGPNLPNDQADIENHFHALAENLIFLVDGKNKEVAGTTYKSLKELLQGVKESGYFSQTSAVNVEEEETSSDDAEIEDVVIEKTSDVEDSQQSDVECIPDVEQVEEVPGEDVEPEVECPNIVELVNNLAVLETEVVQNPNTLSMQNGPLQEVLASHGNFNFLQESQIDLDAPHMDPAVVAVHQMAPPAAMNFAVSSYPAAQLVDEPQNQLINEVELADVTILPAIQQQPISVLTTGVPRTITPVLTSVQHSSHDFDPTHPIPTQTFTNQSFAVMQNMIMPSAYVPVTMHHGHMTPHITPIAVVPGLSPPVSAPTSAAIPIHVTVAPVPIPTATSPVVTLATEIPKTDVENEVCQHLTNGNSSSPELDGFQNGISGEKTTDNEGFTTQNNYRGSYRGRGRARGSSNGYYRGRNNFNNGRGGYHNNYYQGGSNYRRGNSRGGPRGNPNFRGRGTNYRPHQSQQQQEQQ